MKTKTIVWLSILGLFILFFIGGCNSIIKRYNTMTSNDEAVTKTLSQVGNVCQRRADLIPNLVATVKGYAAHEMETFTAVTEARTKATATTIDPSNTTPEQFAAFTNAQNGLSSSLAKLMVVVEKYPELKANENFLALQSQLEGSENRITVERKRYNDAVNVNNAYLRRFPNNIIAFVFGFEKRAYFEADKDAKKTPEVKF